MEQSLAFLLHLHVIRSSVPVDDLDDRGCTGPEEINVGQLPSTCGRHNLPVNFKKETEKVCGVAKKGKQRQPQVGHQIDFGNHVAKALPSSY